MPPLSLLKTSTNKSNYPKEVEKQNQTNAIKLENVLKEYGVTGKIINFQTGPVITLFEFQPSAGIKTSKVIGLAADIARSMSSMSARISSQPGKNSIGIEIPNNKRLSVYLGDLITDDKFELSIKYLEKNIVFNPKSSESYILLGKSYSALENNDKAEKYFKIAYTLIPENVELNYLLGEVSYNLGFIEEYAEYLYDSKVCLSPFGMGEVCFRDFECINVGTIMIKPSMDIVMTNPNIYIDKETYFAVNYDWSNLNEVIDEVLSDFDRLNSEITDNARRKFVSEYQYEDYCFYLYNIFSDMSNITIGEY